jgi:Cu/Ag efflux pump CusA
VRRAAATLVDGVEVNDLWRPARIVDVTVWSTPETRASPLSIAELPIDTPDGGTVRLGDVADIRVAPTPNVIKREAVSRRLDVGGNVQGRDLGSVVHDVEQRLEGVELPLGYRAELIGESAEREAAANRLRYVAIAALLVIFLLIQAAFGSWTLASLFTLTLPMALMGGVIAAYIGGGTISLGSLVGFFTVFGIAARNGILLINHYQHLEREERVPFGLDLVVRGAKERLAPILMTAGATGLAILPLVALGNIPGHEIEHPMAVVILGGLVTSTLVNLFIVPLLYLRFGHGNGGWSLRRPLRWRPAAR